MFAVGHKDLWPKNNQESWQTMSDVFSPTNVQVVVARKERFSSFFVKVLEIKKFLLPLQCSRKELNFEKLGKILSPSVCGARLL